MHELFINWILITLAITLDMQVNIRISQLKIRKNKEIEIKKPLALSFVVCFLCFLVLFPINFVLLPLVISRYLHGDHDLIMDSIYDLLESLAKGKEID
jgi:hypothetical protein